MSEQIQQLVKTYLEQPATDFALLIDGPWGAGKTHFLKNILKPVIESTEVSTRTKKPTKYEILYISLYGVSSIEEIEKRIFMELMPDWTKGKVAKGISNFGKLAAKRVLSVVGMDGLDADAGEAFQSIVEVTDKYVLCFDDIERLPDPIILEEVLGFINRFTEHDGIKTIILGHEEELRSKMDSARYDRIKEKLIRFTSHYSPDIFKLIPDFANRLTNDARNYLTSNASFIADCFRRASHENLRTLRFGFDMYSQIHEIIQTHFSNEPLLTDAKDRLLFFTLVYAIEYKKDQDPERLIQLKYISSDGLNGWNDISLESLFAASTQTTQIDVNQKSQTDEFRETYLKNQNFKFDYYVSVAELIRTGTLEENGLVEEVKALIARLTPKQQHPAYKALERLGQYMHLEDQEAKEITKDVITRVANGEYFLQDYPRIYGLLESIEKMKANSFSISSKTHKNFISGIKKSSGYSIYRDDLLMFFHVDRPSAKMSEIIKQVKEENNKLKEGIIKINAKNVLTAINNQDMLELQKLTSDSNYLFDPIFKFLSPKDVLSGMRRMSNSNKWTLSIYLNDRIQKLRHTQHVRNEEKPFFESFLRELDKAFPATARRTNSTTIFLNLADSLQVTLVD